MVVAIVGALAPPLADQHNLGVRDLCDRPPLLVGGHGWQTVPLCERQAETVTERQAR